jgi:hypothetical protein
MVPIHELTTLSVASACVWWLKKKKGALAICCTRSGSVLSEIATVITRVPCAV